MGLACAFLRECLAAAADVLLTPRSKLHIQYELDVGGGQILRYCANRTGLARVTLCSLGSPVTVS
jgi:hypothetical protein